VTKISKFGLPDAQEGEALVRATIRVIERTGSAEPAVQDILAEANLSTPALYRNFESKSALLLQVHLEAVGRLVRRMEQSLEKCLSASDALECYVDLLLRQASRRGVVAARSFTLASTAFLQEFPTEQRELDAALAAPLVRVIEWGVERGEFASPNPVLDAGAIRDCVNACLRRHLAAGTTPSRKEVHHLVDLAKRAVRR